MLWDMGKRLNALPEVVERVQTCRDGSSPVNQEIVTLGDGPPLDDKSSIAILFFVDYALRGLAPRIALSQWYTISTFLGANFNSAKDY